MKKVTSVRIDDEFLDIAEDLRKIYEQAVGFDFKKSDILEGCLKQGMRHYISTLQKMANSTVIDENGTNIDFGKDIVNAIYELEGRYQDYLYNEV